MYKPSVSLVSFLLLVFIPSRATAQTSDLVGVRAQGMAGAFTAVADDATAAWWNPAGLATGAFLSAIIEYDHPRAVRDETVHGLSIGFPALGLSYYRVPVSQIQPGPTSTAAGSAGRQDEGVLSVFGISVGQSIGQNLVIGSTLKLARADGDTHGGLDIGAMGSFGRARIGLMVRNAKEVEFTGESGLVRTMARQVRAGGAYSTGSRGVIGSATVSLDADLVSTATAFGDVRRFAAGAEIWTTGSVLGLRGGISGSTIGERRLTPSGGVSVSVRSRTFVDAYISRSDTGSDQFAWGTGLRVTF
jgi:hypothetical protein